MRRRTVRTSSTEFARRSKRLIRAALRYGCFGRFDDDPQEYGYASSIGLTPSCEAEVVSRLVALRGGGAERPIGDERRALFWAMLDTRVSSWIGRDRHMAGTLDALLDFRGARAHDTETSQPRSRSWR